MMHDSNSSEHGAPKRDRSPTPEVVSPTTRPPNAKRHRADDDEVARLRAELAEARRMNAELDARNAELAEVRRMNAELDARNAEACRMNAELEARLSQLGDLNTEREARKKKVARRPPVVNKDNVAANAKPPRKDPELVITQDMIDNAKKFVDDGHHALIHKKRAYNDCFLTLPEQSAFVEAELIDLSNYSGNLQLVMKADPRASKSAAIVTAAVSYLKSGKKLCVIVTGTNKNKIYISQQACYEEMMNHLGNISNLFIDTKPDKEKRLKDPVNPYTRADAYYRNGIPFIIHVGYNARSLSKLIKMNANIDDLAIIFDEVQNKLSGDNIAPPLRETYLMDLGFARSTSCYVSATHGDTMDVIHETENCDNFTVIRECKIKRAARNFFDVSREATFFELPSDEKGDAMYTDKNGYGFRMNYPADSDDGDGVYDAAGASSSWDWIDASLGKVFKNCVLVPGNMTCFFGLRLVEGKGSNLGKIASYIFDLSQTPTAGFEPIPSDKLSIIAHWGGGAHVFRNVPSVPGNVSTREVVHYEKGSVLNVPDLIATLHLQQKLAPDSTIVVLSNLAYDGSLDYQIAGSFKNMKMTIKKPNLLEAFSTTVAAQVVLAPYKNSVVTQDKTDIEFKVKTAYHGVSVTVSSNQQGAEKVIGGVDKFVVFDYVRCTLMAAEADDENVDVATLNMEPVIVDIDGCVSVPDTLIDKLIAFTSKKFNVSNTKQGVSRPNGPNRSKPLEVFMSRRAIQSVLGLNGAEEIMFRNLEGVMDVTKCEDAALNAHRGHMKRPRADFMTNVYNDDYAARRNKLEETDNSDEDDSDDADMDDDAVERDWTDREILNKILAVIDLAKERREAGKKRASSEVVFTTRAIIEAGVIAEKDTSRMNDLVRRKFVKALVPDVEYVVSTLEYKKKMRKLFAELDVETRTLEKRFMTASSVKDYKMIGLIEEVEGGAKIRPTAKAYRAFMNGDTLLLWFAKTRTEFRGTFDQLYAAINAAFPEESSLLIAGRHDSGARAKNYIHFGGGFSKELFEVVDDIVMTPNGAKTKKVYRLKERGTIRSILEGSP